MMRSSGLTLWLLLVSLLSLNGCAVFNRSYVEPEISLADVEMLKSNLWEQSFRLRLRVDNPNDRNLPIRGMQYQIYLNNARLATGVTDRAFDVPAYGSEYFDLTVRSNIWRHLRDLLKTVESQKPIDYRITGHISTGYFWAPRINLNQAGTLDPANLSIE